MNAESLYVTGRKMQAATMSMARFSSFLTYDSRVLPYFRFLFVEL